MLSLLEAQPPEKATGARSISVYRLKARVAAVAGLSSFADELVGPDFDPDPVSDHPEPYPDINTHPS